MIDFRVDDYHSLLDLDGFFLGVAYFMMGVCLSANVVAAREMTCRVKPCNKKHALGNIVMTQTSFGIED
jgi:hypothetical protein